MELAEDASIEILNEKEECVSLKSTLRIIWCGREQEEEEGCKTNNSWRKSQKKQKASETVKLELELLCERERERSNKSL